MTGGSPIFHEISICRHGEMLGSGIWSNLALAMKNDQRRQNIGLVSNDCDSKFISKIGTIRLIPLWLVFNPFLNHSNGAIDQTFAPRLRHPNHRLLPPWAEQQPGTSSPETQGYFWKPLRKPHWSSAKQVHGPHATGGWLYPLEQYASASVFQ